MEDWLFKKDNYKPVVDKDKFIDKSIFSILQLLSLIKRNNKISNNFMYKLNPSVKLIFTILNIIFISLSKNFTYILALNAYFLLLLSLLEVEEIKRILLISTVIPIFTAIMLIPSILMGNVTNSLLLILRVSATIMSINILSYTTKWHHITKTLKILCIPDIFIFVFDITIKYIYILGEFSLEMLYALRLRSIGKNNKKYSSISKIIGNLFLKSKEMGDEMYSAMECRGFTGEYSSHIKFSFNFRDAVYLVINIFIIVIYFYTNRM